MYISTTGKIQNVVIRDVGGVLLSHPTSLMDVSFFDTNKVNDSSVDNEESLAYHIENGNVHFYDKNYNRLFVSDLPYIEENQPIDTSISGLNRHLVDIYEKTGWQFEGVKDYYYIRQKLEAKCNEVRWNNLNNSQKQIICDYNAHKPESDLYAFYMSQGKTQQEADNFFWDSWESNHIKTVPCCQERFHYAKKIFFRRLTMESASNFCDNEVVNINNFMFNAIKGSDYGDIKDGLLDFIESTNSRQANGMQQVSEMRNPNDTWQSIINDLKDVLINANYTKIE
jgi:hypothetical protein